MPGQRTKGSVPATRPEGCPEDKGLWPVGFEEGCIFYSAWERQLMESLGTIEGGVLSSGPPSGRRLGR